MTKLVSLILAILILSSITCINFNTSSSITDGQNSPLAPNTLFNSKLQESQMIERINNLDGYFTENRGQINNGSVKYYIQGKGVWFLEDGIIFEIREPIKRPESSAKHFNKYDPDFLHGLDNPVKQKRVVLKLNFEGSNKILPRGEDLLPHRSNFFYGNDSSKWYTEVPNFQEIIYENIFNKIDLRYYSNDKGLKYDFIVHPGGTPNDIILKYEGAQDLLLDKNHNLMINTPIGNLVDSELVIYQDSNANRKMVSGVFKKIDAITYGFEINSDYEKNKDLIIDPLIYSTYFGGTLYDHSCDSKIDANNNVYVTGNTWSVDIPCTPGAYTETFQGGLSDAFVFKLDSSGSTLIYSTYIGGNDCDSGNSLTIDANENIFITGYTNSTNFPITENSNDTTINGDYDVFVLHLNRSGSFLLYSTYIGGEKYDFCYEIEIDTKNYAYVTGLTKSHKFPLTPNAVDKDHDISNYDGFIFKLDPTGTTLVYSTLIGGYSYDYCSSIAIDTNENIYVTGKTRSDDFPITNGSYDTTHNSYPQWCYDIFVLKLNSDGSSINFSTFIGGIDEEGTSDIELDQGGNIYLTGFTSSIDFPVTTNALNTSINGNSDVFILKLNSNGSSLLYSTFIGGESDEYGCDIKCEQGNNIYVVGNTESINFPTTFGAYNTQHNGSIDIFFLWININKSEISYSTFIGGNFEDYSNCINLDSNGNIYVSGITEYFFPTTDEAYDNTHNGWSDAIVFKMKINNPPIISNHGISSSIINRTNSIFLYVNVSDYEDIEKDLTPHFEYSISNKSIWNNNYFSLPKYQNSRWEVNFKPLKDAILGIYDFRVRFNDTDLVYGKWENFEESLMVINNNPLVKNILFLDSEIFRGEDVPISINGIDIENNEYHLTLELKYKNRDNNFWREKYINSIRYKENCWKCTFSIPNNASVGYYDFKARFLDKDGNYSSWLYQNNSLLVKNNPILINIPDTNLIMYEDTNKILNLSDWFQDPEGEKLVFNIDIQNNISITQFENGSIILIPKPDWNGNENIIITANDTIDEVRCEIQVKVLPVNDRPETPIIYEPEDGSKFNTSTKIDFIGYCNDADLIYDDELNFTWISNISGLIGFGKELYNLTLLPGYHKITLIVTDLEKVSNSTSVFIFIIKLINKIEENIEYTTNIDSDNDTYNDTYEILRGTDPFDNASYPLDTDSDGIFDYLDSDDDNDGYNDNMEWSFGTNPLDSNDTPPDLDQDFLPDLIDPDIDGDGVLNDDDEYPYDPEKSEKQEIDYISILSAITGIALLILLLMILFFMVKKKKIRKDHNKKSN